MPKREQEYPAKICINKTQGGNDELSITIRVIDIGTGITMAEVRMKPADFADAVFGHAFMPALFSAQHTELLGYTCESKNIREFVRVEDYSTRPLVAFEAAQKYCVDGWEYTGPRKDAGSHASWSQGDWLDYDNPMGRGPTLSNSSVRLRFERYVLPEAQPIIRQRVRRPDNT
jgi:hypothetical protein